MRLLPDTETQIPSAVLSRPRKVSSIILAEKDRLSWAIPQVSPRIHAHVSWLEQELADLDGRAPPRQANLCRSVRIRNGVKQRLVIYSRRLHQDATNRWVMGNVQSGRDNYE